MKRIGISFLSLLVSLFISWCAGYLGDLAYIGGYDGFASEELATEFWYGRCSGWVPIAEVGFKTAIVVGPIGILLSFGALLYFLFKEISKYRRKVL